MTGTGIELGAAATATAGVVVLSVVGIAYGGTFVLRVLLGHVEVTEFQRSCFRAGHAHAGVLVTLGLVCLLLSEATGLGGFWGWYARTGVLVAAVLLPAGFFLGAAGRGRTRPGRLFVLVPTGAVVLTGGLVTLGVGLLTA